MQLPTALKVVAWIFIVTGFLSVIDIVGHMASGKLHIDFGVIKIFVGFGLLARRSLARKIALIFVCFSLIVTPIIVALALASSQPAKLEFFGVYVGEAPSHFAAAYGVPFLVLAIWEYHVLNRPDVRAYY